VSVALVGIIEALLLAILGFLVMFWRWHVIKKERQALEISWRSLRKATEDDIAALEAQCLITASNINDGKNNEINSEENGSEESLTDTQPIHTLTTEFKLRCLKGMMEMFGKNLSNGIKNWSHARDTIFIILSQLETEIDRMAEKDFQSNIENENLKLPLPAEEQEVFSDPYIETDSRPRLEHLPVMEEIPKEEYVEAITSFEEQNTGITALHDYKEDLNKLVTKSQMLSATNHKLLEQLRLLAERNKEAESIRQMLDLAQQNTYQLESIVTDLEHQKSRLEPKITILEQENQQLVLVLTHHRQRIKTLTQQINDIVQEKIDLGMEKDEIEKKLASRTRSYWSLRKESDTLRKKYMMLVNSSIKVPKPSR